MKKITIDKEKCIGCGACASVASKSFKIGDDGKAQAIDPIGDDEATIQSAIDGCPTSAISWQE